MRIMGKMIKDPRPISRTKSREREVSVRVERVSYFSSHGKAHAIIRTEIAIK